MSISSQAKVDFKRALHVYFLQHIVKVASLDPVLNCLLFCAVDVRNLKSEARFPFKRNRLRLNGNRA